MNHRLVPLTGNVKKKGKSRKETRVKYAFFFRHHTWVGHPREAVKIDNDHIAVYSEQNIIASLNTQSGAVGKKKRRNRFNLFHHHLNMIFFCIAWRQIFDNELDHFLASKAGKEKKTRKRKDLIVNEKLKTLQ